MIKTKRAQTSDEQRLYFEPFCICPVGDLFIRTRIGPYVDLESGEVKSIKTAYDDPRMKNKKGLFTSSLPYKKIMSIKYNFR